MARRASLIQSKQKEVRKTKTENYLINLKYLGDEPSFVGEVTSSQYGKALTWYNYMCTTSDAREYLETYLKNQARTAELKTFKKAKDTWVPTTAAWVARLINRGYALPEEARPFLEKSLKEALSKSEDDAQELAEEKKETVNIQKKINDKTSDIIAEIESIIDEHIFKDGDMKFSLYDWLKANDIPSVYCLRIAEFYRPWLVELCDAYIGKDADLKEGYSYLSKKQLKQRVDFFNRLVEDAERYGTNVKKARAPRKKKPVSIEKKLKNFKFQKEDTNFKIASVSPDKIVGCNELWTFNTKYKTLTVFRAQGPAGLDINRTSIIGYDESSSMTKRTGRKPEYFIDKVLNGGKIVLRKLMDEAKGEASLTFRINENTILLKIT